MHLKLTKAGEDKEKIGELKEIEQEEIYINMLKEQRERVYLEIKNYE